MPSVHAADFWEKLLYFLSPIRVSVVQFSSVPGTVPQWARTPREQRGPKPKLFLITNDYVVFLGHDFYLTIILKKI